MCRMKRRIKWWRAHEERKLRGGFVWERVFKWAKRSYQGKEKERSFDVADLPRMSLSMFQSINGESTPDMGINTPRLTLTRIERQEDPEPVSIETEARGSHTSEDKPTI